MTGSNIQKIQPALALDVELLQQQTNLLCRIVESGGGPITEEEVDLVDGVVELLGYLLDQCEESPIL